MSLPLDTLLTLREKLPHGWQKLVLAELKRGGIEVSPALLTLTLKGERSNVTVLNAIVLVANNYQNELRQIADRVASMQQPAEA